MSTPCLHSASVATSVPSASMIASSKNAAGCCAQTRSRVSLMASIRSHDVGLGEAAAEVAGGGGVGDAFGAQGVEIDLVVAPQFEVLEPLAAGQEVEGDVQDVVGFVVGQVPLEEVEVARRCRGSGRASGPAGAWRRCRRRRGPGRGRPIS